MTDQRDMLSNTELRNLLERIANGDSKVSRASAFRTFLGDIYTWADHRILHRLGGVEEDASDNASAIFEAFLEKVSDASFCVKAATAENAKGYLSATIDHLVSDWGRGQLQEKTERLVSGQNDEASFALAATVQSSDPATDILLEQEEERAQKQSILDDLGPEDWLLLKLCYAHMSKLSDEDLAAVAARRGCTVARIQEEIATRERAQDAKEEQIRIKQEGRLSRVNAIYRQLRRVRDVMRSEGDPPIEETLPDVDQRERFRQSREALTDATPQERAGYHTFLENLNSDVARKYQEVAKQGDRHMPAGPRYDELAVILGEIDATTPNDQKRKIVNTLTRRIIRLRRRLRAAENEALSEHDNGE